MNTPYDIADPESPGKRSGGDRRRAIALAARDLIVEKGFEGLRTRDIAERVGINIATLHYHVPTKETLIGLVAESMREEFIAQHIGRDRAAMTPLALLRAEFDDFLDLLENRPGLLAVLSELLERGRRDDKVMACMLPLQHKWRAIVTDILARGRQEGTFRPDLDPEAGASMIIGTMTGFWRGPDADSHAFQRLAAELERAVINPILPKDA